MSQSQQAQPISRRRLTVVLGALAAIGPLSIDMYLPAFPTVAASLGTSVAAVQLTLSTYLAGLACGQLISGPLSDRLGRRLPLLLGLGLYVLASLACAMAPTLPLLALARFVQALGGCAGMVISRAVVRDLYGERESAQIFSTLMLAMGAAPILAPILGGQLLAAFGWQAIFLTLAGTGLTLALVIAFGLPESLPKEARSRHSPLQTFRSGGQVLADRTFLRRALATGGSQAAMFAYISGSPFVFIELYGVPAEHFGFIFGANAFGLIAASQLNRLLVDRIGVIPALRRAIVVGVVAQGVLLLAVGSGAGLWLVLPPLFLAIATGGVSMPNGSAAALAPHGRRAGIASALLGTVQTSCGAVAAALVSALADGTALPMAAVMLGFGLLALAAVVGETIAARQQAPLAP